jgi:hypothetical protein
MTDQLDVEIEALKAENKRLREALELIADDDCTSACKTLDKICDPCIASAALANK